ncbi:S-formylglutathione hydrolase [Mycena kentingensis (nom. inval.)]|nr:S-formylglutathione hydrolase [Mycena kentingensis (nom. inval.)]
MTDILELVSENRVFEGQLRKYKFKSAALGGLSANFNLYLPPQSTSAPVPVLVYLSDATSYKHDIKGNFFEPAAAHGIALLFPDTSPRGAGIEGEDSDWDFGTGAGFYLNATNPKYSKHYNMLTHVTLELPQVIAAAGLPVDWTRQSIFGHSMGGHGALTLYLSSATKQYRSASAFAPICNPTQCPWGQKAFAGFLQGGVDEAKDIYDATELIKKHKDPVNILVHYGTADNFYKQKQLLPENFAAAAKEAGKDVEIHAVEGYDHSYFFISTFAVSNTKLASCLRSTKTERSYQLWVQISDRLCAKRG